MRARRFLVQRDRDFILHFHTPLLPWYICIFGFEIFFAGYCAWADKNTLAIIALSHAWPPLHTIKRLISGQWRHVPPEEPA